MNPARFGRGLRTLRIRQRLRQVDLSRLARIPRTAISLAERGRPERLTYGQLQALTTALGARLDLRLLWNGPELEKLLDAGHAALQAALKGQLEGWGWEVRVEFSYSHYGERGRIDVLAYHAATHILLVIEIKTELVDVQALLGSVDAKVRLAPHIVAPLGWRPAIVIPAIVFAEDKTTRRRVRELAPLFDRFSLRGRDCLVWLRAIGASSGSAPGSAPRAPADSPSRVAAGSAPGSAPAVTRAGSVTGSAPQSVPTGLLWFTSRSTGAAQRISGQRAHIKRVRRRPGPSMGPGALGGAPAPEAAAGD